MKKHIVLIMNIVLVIVILGAAGFTLYNVISHQNAAKSDNDTETVSALPSEEETEQPTINPSERYKIGIVQHSNSADGNDCYAGFISELNDRGLIGNVDIVYIIEENEERCNAEIRRIIDEGCDLLCTIGPFATTAAASMTTDIPIVFAGVSDPEKVGLIDSNETPGGNITGVSSYTPTFEQIDLINVLLPQAKTVAAIYNSTDVNAVTQVVIGVGEADELGLKVDKYPITRSSDLDDALASIKEAGTQVIFLPVDKSIYNKMDEILAFANENKIPVFVGNENMLKKGAFATCTVNYTSVGRKAAGLSYDILFGKKDPASLPIVYKYDCYNLINQASIDALGIRLNATMRDQAQIMDYSEESVQIPASE